MPTIREQCDNCKWWDKHSDTSDNGYCRKYAPKPQYTPLLYIISWPVTPKDQKACGDYIKK